MPTVLCNIDRWMKTWIALLAKPLGLYDTQTHELNNAKFNMFAAADTCEKWKADMPQSTRYFMLLNLHNSVADKVDNFVVNEWGPSS